MSFHSHASESLLWLSSSLLDGHPVRHGFSTRKGGVSPAPWDSLNLGISRGDDTENVRENYRRFCTAVGVRPESTVLSCPSRPTRRTSVWSRRRMPARDFLSPGTIRI